MAKAKLTINRTQAQALGLLVSNTKSSYPLLYDPRSGINLRQTKPGKHITVKDGADTYNLVRFQRMGLFSVVEGSILPPPTLKGLRIADQIAEVMFDKPVRHTDLLCGSDFTLTIDGVECEDLEVEGRKTLRNTVQIPLGTDVGNAEVIFTLTTNGASRIYDKFNACAKPTAENEELRRNRDPEVPTSIELLCDPSVIRLDRTLDVNATINVIVKNQYGEVMAGEENNVVLELAEGNDPEISFDLVDSRMLVLAPTVVSPRVQILATHEGISGDPASLMIDIESAAVPTSVILTANPDTVQLDTDSTISSTIAVTVFNQYDEEMPEEEENILLSFENGTDEDIKFAVDSNRIVVFPLSTDIAEEESPLSVVVVAEHIDAEYSECTEQLAIIVKHPSRETTLELSADPTTVILNDIGGDSVTSTISAIVRDQYTEEMEAEVSLNLIDGPIAGVSIEGNVVSFAPECVVPTVNVEATSGLITDTVAITVTPYSAE